MSSADSEPKIARSVGTLLRIAHAAAVEEYVRWLSSSPYRDIQPAHAAVIQPLSNSPKGARLTELARSAHITKQSMSALVESLEAGGYIERVDDPDDRRASRIRLTARGRGFARDARTFARGFERRLAEQIGSSRLEELRTALELLVGSLRPMGT
jgi:DNA-binding MarR family transcriptional regulator